MKGTECPEAEAEAGPMADYVIAVKRTMREELPQNWQSQLEDIDGLTLLSPPARERVLVSASPDALRHLDAQLGRYLRIEPLIRHQTSR
ncbi:MULTISPECIES: hypothetical protein [Leisingera]|jgi:hypothetical protein|uniref:Uncharacterized protein n=3 Tax=Leisingera aquaemixtae TaxID=1396826 RepID=A0ABY5WL21_9RHOB|nr:MULTISPECIES: hypothetical protein [Leisingera]QDI76771.1 hypothetical protein R2C4_13800 [Leisingera aquaemixtae]UWQ42177.1 hypothetical protein K3718_03545 [Leisingera aquaemixtae]